MARWRAGLGWRRVSLIGLGLTGGVSAVLYVYPQYQERCRMKNKLRKVYAASVEQDSTRNSPLPTRQQHLNELENQQYDVLVIGGGATGTGVALDAVSRGLKTAIIEKNDFASGTSSRSTKLVHGGVRYLQKAILNLDIEQYRMVKEALSERAHLTEVAPHLSHSLPILLPIYKWWQVPYFWLGLKMYDFVAGKEILKTSYYINKSEALERFPMLKSEHLVGGIVYYDGQQNDARMCLSLAVTAARMGATVCNYVNCDDLVKQRQDDGTEIVSGAKVTDRFTDKTYNVRAKCVINATGPFTDGVRQMDDSSIKKICAPSAGIHLVLPKYYCESTLGLLDPSTSDGRILFILPWLDSTVVGTTDTPCDISESPEPQEAEIKFVLSELKRYLSKDISVRREDVLSVWSGIRPLVRNPNKQDTQSIARNHVIEVSKSNLITIAGGKWTTYRLMAEETIDKAVELCNLKASKCCTHGLLIEGAHGWSPTLFLKLVQDYGVAREIAEHLVETYGDRAEDVVKLCDTTKRWPMTGKRLHPDYPYIQAEVKYAVVEYGCTAVDVLARRTRLSFINARAAYECLPTVIEIMSEQLNWNSERIEAEKEKAIEFLQKEMGLDLHSVKE
ncbi:glycerol-3-phosphate dehydrogenase, mitochondrial-like [Tubulanus polymorphus]|uniref:glycerol-3-phosphate dehydrogenase, mitochondrial-like n=1 Tax=Tubulanus polymorphus TaxID=672921 RepID=UPI003DA29068